MVRIPRLTTPKHIAYAVVSTWRSCGLLVGDSASLGPTILQNADEHIIRFIEAWRFANTPPPDPRFPATSDLSTAGRQYRRWRDNGTLAAGSHPPRRPPPTPRISLLRQPDGLHTTVVFAGGGRTFEVIAPGDDKASELATAVAKVILSKLGA